VACQSFAGLFVCKTIGSSAWLKEHILKPVASQQRRQVKASAFSTFSTDHEVKQQVSLHVGANAE